MEPVIACSHSLYWVEAAWDTRLCTLRSARLAKLNGGTWLYCVSTSVRVGSGERWEEGELLLTG